MEGQFRTTFDIDPEDRSLFQELVRELTDWRLAEYLERASIPGKEQEEIVCKVSHADNRPILFLPPRESNPNIPNGWTDVLVEGELYEANFVKVAVNVVRRKGGQENELPRIMRTWLGANAGLPGTIFRVAFRRTEQGLTLEPIGRSERRDKLEL